MIPCLLCDKGVNYTFSGKPKGVELVDIGICNDCLKNNKVPSFTKYNKLEPNDDIRKQIIKQINDEMIQANVPQEKIDMVNKDLEKLERWYENDRIKASKTPEQLEQEKKEKEEEYMKRFRSHKVSTTFNIEGYRIVEYHDVVAGEYVAGTGIFSSLSASIKDAKGRSVTPYQQKLSSAKEGAEKTAIIKSTDLGGNAIVGASVNYVNFSSDMIGVIFTGTSVTIEPIEKVEDVEEDKPIKE